jgi:hypothetical protein
MHSPARLLLPLLLFAASCTVAHQTIGRPIPASVDLLRIGHTTKAEALSMLGPPVSVRRQFDGDLLFYRRDTVESWGILLVASRTATSWRCSSTARVCCPASG